ncbi:MAG: hypothetical protein AAFQ07_14695, partial [Chloroflexota bacterium]
GASGSGKSSLVMAGLLPRLADSDAPAITGSADWHVVRFTPTENPLEAFADALMRGIPALDVADPIDYPERLDKLIDSIRAKPENLVRMLTHALRDDDEWVEVLLFVDQFEELFTLSDLTETAIFAEILDAIANSQRVRTVVTMRHDFYHKAVENAYLAELLRGGSFPLAIPKRDALREMIERPAERAGLTWDADLVTRILDDTGNQPGNLALMAYALDELYKRSAGTLTAGVYNELGGVQGAIGTRAESEWQKLNMDDSVLQQVFHALVEVDERGTATRQRADLEKFTGDARQLIDAFVDARLLVTSSSQVDAPLRVPTDTVGTSNGMSVKAIVEVAHEAILRQWGRLVDWVAEAQEDLILLRQVKNATTNWVRQGRPDFLRWQHERLELVYTMLERLKPQLSKNEYIFIEREQERLYRELEDVNTTHQRRYDIGERLSRIGDYREGIGVKNGLPEIVWLLVKG